MWGGVITGQMGEFSRSRGPWSPWSLRLMSGSHLCTDTSCFLLVARATPTLTSLPRLFCGCRGHSRTLVGTCLPSVLAERFPGHSPPCSSAQCACLAETPRRPLGWGWGGNPGHGHGSQAQELPGHPAGPLAHLHASWVRWDPMGPAGWRAGAWLPPSSVPACSQVL